MAVKRVLAHHPKKNMQIQFCSAPSPIKTYKCNSVWRMPLATIRALTNFYGLM